MGKPEQPHRQSVGRLPAWSCGLAGAEATASNRRAEEKKHRARMRNTRNACRESNVPTDLASAAVADR
jgi:hypothetical protein